MNVIGRNWSEHERNEPNNKYTHIPWPKVRTKVVGKLGFGAPRLGCKNNTTLMSAFVVALCVQNLFGTPEKEVALKYLTFLACPRSTRTTCTFYIEEPSLIKKPIYARPTTDKSMVVIFYFTF